MEPEELMPLPVVWAIAHGAAANTPVAAMAAIANFLDFIEYVLWLMFDYQPRG